MRPRSEVTVASTPILNVDGFVAAASPRDVGVAGRLLRRRRGPTETAHVTQRGPTSIRHVVSA